MAIQTITNPNIIGLVENSILPLAKIAVISVALNTIQSLGVLANSLTVQTKILEDNRIWLSTETVKAFSYFFSSAEIGPSDEPFLVCISDSSGKCLLDRKNALQEFQEEVETSLPKTYEESLNSPVQDCFNPEDCFDINPSKIHQREKKATESIHTAKHLDSKTKEYISWLKSMFRSPEWKNVQEILRFRADDPRDKFLYISAEYDYNGASEPWLMAAKILSKLAFKFDLKYQVVRRHKNICKAIKSAARVGNLAHVLIHGHGDTDLIAFDAKKIIVNEEEEWFLVDHMSHTTNYAKCFSGINPNGRVILQSCSTGGKEEDSKDPFDNIAQKMADASKRVVIAPTNSSYSILTSFLSDDDVVLYHPENLYSFLPFFNTNLFTSFRPTFKRCYPKIDEKKLTRRESLTKDAIKTELIAKSLLHKEIRNSFSHQFLQICKDDPRDKVLYFSAQYDKNQALRSSSNDKLLALLADRFDLMFKEVSLFDEICDTINSVARFDRKVSVVIIQAHGTPENGMILSINPDGSEEKIDVSSAFKKCFANVEENGTIIPMGAAIGQSGSHVNIAQKIADLTKRTVLAPTCLIHGNDITILSIEPFRLKHPARSFFLNLFMWCSENNENLFKKFNPKKTNFHEEL